MEIVNFECLKCGHKWIPRITNPRCCPLCISPTWQEPRTRPDKTSVDVKRRRSKIVKGKEV